MVEKPKELPQRNNVDLTRLPLQEQNPGIIAWAKIAGHNWWPGNTISVPPFTISYQSSLVSILFANYTLPYVIDRFDFHFE